MSTNLSVNITAAPSKLCDVLCVLNQLGATSPDATRAAVAISTWARHSHAVISLFYRSGLVLSPTHDLFSQMVKLGLELHRIKRLDHFDRPA